jgi:uncharacterized phosphosugar-binding protein
VLDWASVIGEAALTISSQSVPPCPVSMQFSVIGAKLVMTR